MPLAFASRSHGTVAFGFFNIASDMLLLEQLFFFADRFCEAAQQLAAGQPEAILDGWRITDPAARGNLHGAIAGVDLSGFIGATYHAWPFPARPEEFKQDPDGSRTQDQVKTMISPWGHPEAILLRRRPGQLALGEYQFDGPGFSALVDYVDRGGYPRWRDERRPPYVTQLTRGWAAQARDR